MQTDREHIKYKETNGLMVFPVMYVGMSVNPEFTADLTPIAKLDRKCGKFLQTWY